jgi:NAD(P)H-nitrite reductase large subunit
MPAETYTYIIVGAGLTGASAIRGIRERDKNGSILLLGKEKHLPYNRPPLTKELWFGKKTVEKIFVNEETFYGKNYVKIIFNTTVTAIDVNKKIIRDEKDRTYHYEKLLLATGGIPRTLPVPGSDLRGICYYRYLDDYLKLRPQATEGKSAVIIGGGFIGSEISAALNINKLQVTMIFPDSYLVQRIFPRDLGNALQRHYIDKGIKIIPGDKPAEFSKKADKFITRTANDAQIESDILIVGTGIIPASRLAETASLKVSNGIEVNEYLQTSDPHIYAAGDNALFPYQALGRKARIEHWDNAMTQGKWAGANMAGANAPFEYMPYFFSDLFKFGYEAVGEINSELETFTDWKKENDTGVIYYLKDKKVKGVMLCNVWKQIDAARELIKKNEEVSPTSLRGAIG